MFPPKKSDLIVGLLLADIQAGSRLAPIRPDLVLPKTGWRPNRGQIYLWEKWQNMMKLLPGELDWFVHLGETVQGPYCERGSSYESLTNDKLEQLMIFEDLIGPVVDRVKSHSSGQGKAWWMCRGSKWHEGEYGREADVVAKMLGAQPHPDGEPSGDILDLPIGPFLCNFAHHHPVFLQYKTSALERELKWFAESPIQVEHGDGEAWAHYDLVVRGHVHRYDCVDTALGMALSCPGWQLQMRYTVAKDVARSYPPHIGFVLVYMSPSEKEKGRKAIWVDPVLYPHPRRRAATL